MIQQLPFHHTMRGFSPILRNVFIRFQPDIGEHIRSLAGVKAPRAESWLCLCFLVNTSFSGSHYIDKDISKATIKIKVLHNPQYVPLTSLRYYCMFAFTVTSQKHF